MKTAFCTAVLIAAPMVAIAADSPGFADPEET